MKMRSGETGEVKMHAITPLKTFDTNEKVKAVLDQVTCLQADIGRNILLKNSE